MRGKVGLVIGLAAGYVLGARAGRERYVQICEQAGKVWHLPAVQAQVDKAKDAGKSALLALPRALWDTAVGMTHAASSGGTAGERLDAAVDAGRASADDIAAAAQTTVHEVTNAGRDRGAH